MDAVVASICAGKVGAPYLLLKHYTIDNDELWLSIGGGWKEGQEDEMLLPNLPSHFLRSLSQRPRVQPPNHSRSRRPKDHGPPKKRAKLTAPAAIQEAQYRQCCKSVCLLQLPRQTIEHVRQIFASADEKGRMQQLIVFIQTGKDAGLYKLSYSYQGKKLCFTAVLSLFGCSKKKFLHARRIYFAGGSILSHRRGGLKTISNRYEELVAWLSLLFGMLGDKMPDGTIHMPILLTWAQVHMVYVDEIENAYHYRVFRACVTTHFPKVDKFVEELLKLSVGQVSQESKVRQVFHLLFFGRKALAMSKRTGK